ncbi:MAG TPA: hypothetical protein VND93_01715 [Myxococcales bacterium]|nr:hypothetical protein [Myxococcales bacterium]
MPRDGPPRLRARLRAHLGLGAGAAGGVLLSPPPKPWPQSLADRLARLSLGPGDRPLGAALQERIGWLQEAERGEDLAAALEDERLKQRGPSVEQMEHLAELHQALVQQVAAPAGRLKRAKAFVLRLLRLYTRPQVEWNQAVMEILARQDRALAALLARVEALERGQRRLLAAQSRRSRDW